MGRKRKQLQQKRATYAIVVDGETEVWYFQMLKRNEPSLRVNIEPKIPQKKSLREQYKKVKQLAEDYTKVFWVIDFDDVIEKTRKTKKGTRTPIQYLQECLQDLEKKRYENVTPIVNNPCLEFWFLLHYKQTTRYFDRCLDAEKQLKKYLNNYEKKREFFTKQNNDIYLKLKPKLKDAISNARKTGRIDFSDIEKGLCEMYLFFETETIKDINN